MNYILNSGSEGLGFYKANAQSLSAHKAYLHVSANAARSFLGFSFEDDATGISTMPTDGERVNHSIYDLQGRRVSAPQKGLYIVNGKKVLVK